jgi:imidazoleglycerol-phosphate dehydratase/histidinol-phosphatase
MKRVLFIDRDGTLIVEPSDKQIDSLEKLEFVPGVFTWLGKIARESGFELVMVTNQDGLGTSSFPEEDFWPAHNKMITALGNEGIHFAEVFIDRSLPSENRSTRKPGTGMLTSFLSPQYDLKNSFVVGDRPTDMQLARNLGCKGILLCAPGLQGPEADGSAEVTVGGWEAIYTYLVLRPRTSEILRKTGETEIRVSLNLDGSGNYDIRTGLRFFDHMLEQLARHGGIDLTVTATGDLQVDEHHTIEDTGIALGLAFDKALADKRGIERYGFLLPMDDCLAQVAIDFGGRPWLEWKAEFKRERIGDVPTEMFSHFFKSFSDNARCNLSITASGSNEHHKIESIFKAFSRTLKSASRRTDPLHMLPTTKEML